MKFRAILILLLVAVVLGVILYVVSRPKPTTPPEPRYYVWDFEMDDLKHIIIDLAKEEKSEAFTKHEDRYFYFDKPDGVKVDMERWGGGIPLILSGPGANRLIEEYATEAQLAEFGFNDPSIKIKLTIKDDEIYNILVGDSTPNKEAYYIKMADQRAVFTVDYTWYDVISRLVTEPPYAAPSFTVTKPVISPTEVNPYQPVTISVEVTNTGGLTGSVDIVLKINSVLEQTRTVTIDPNRTQKVVFTVSREQSGRYAVNVNNQVGNFVVK